MANAIYNYFKKAVAVGSFNLGALPTLYSALVNNSYSPNVDTDIYRSAIASYEVVGTAYVSGGVALSSPNIQLDLTGNQAILNATAIVWTASTITARGAVIYGSSGLGAASDPLVTYLDFVTDQSSSAGNFTVSFPNGVLSFT